MADLLEQARAIRAAMDAAGEVLDDGKAVEAWRCTGHGIPQGRMRWVRCEGMGKSCTVA